VDIASCSRPVTEELIWVEAPMVVLKLAMPIAEPSLADTTA